MSAIISFSMKNSEGKYVNYTLSINDKPDQYGNNCSVTLSQTKEEREAKAKKTYVGNGKVVWTDGKIETAPKVERNNNSNNGQDLPF